MIEHSTYWSGRATLCSSLDDNELYDRAFTAWFTDSPQVPRAEGRVPTGRSASSSLRWWVDLLGRILGINFPTRRFATRASTAEVLRHRDVATPHRPGARPRLATLFDAARRCSARCAAALRRRPHRRGAVDLRRTLRAQLRTAGELTPAPPPTARGAAPAEL